MTFYFSKQTQSHSLTWLMLTFVVSNICHSNNLNYQYLLNKLSATIKKLTSCNFSKQIWNYYIPSIDNFCSDYLNYYDLIFQQTYIKSLSYLIC